jgi:hypothetical protein
MKRPAVRKRAFVPTDEQFVTVAARNFDAGANPNTSAAADGGRHCETRNTTTYETRNTRTDALTKTVADQFAEILVAAGVKRIYGVVGDSLNGLTNALRRQGKIECIHVRHEEVGAFAAGARR